MPERIDGAIRVGTHFHPLVLRTAVDCLGRALIADHAAPRFFALISQDF
jgi:hypothetical protein